MDNNSDIDDDIDESKDGLVDRLIKLRNIIYFMHRRYYHTASLLFIKV